MTTHPFRIPAYRITSTIADLNPGDIVWITPWTLHVYSQTSAAVPANASYDWEESGTANLMIQRTKTGVLVDIYSCEPHTWQIATAKNPTVAMLPVEGACGRAARWQHPAIAQERTS